MGNVKRYIADKDPDAVLPYGFDWSSWLSTGDTIRYGVWEVTSPSGDSSPIVADSTSVSGSVTSVTLSGGTVGNEYQVRCRMTTDGGLIDDRTIYITVRQR